MIDVGMTISLGQLVADADIIRMIKRTLQGVPVNDLSLAIEVINNVGPGGHFLGEEHTLENMRQCQSAPKLINRDNRDEWTRQGSVDMMTKASEEARRILETYYPKVLSDEQVAKIRTMVEAAEKEFGVK